MPRCPHCTEKALIFKGQHWDFLTGREVQSIEFECHECGKNCSWVLED